jgi:hypothetical protein
MIRVHSVLRLKFVVETLMSTAGAHLQEIPSSKKQASKQPS